MRLLPDGPEFITSRRGEVDLRPVMLCVPRPPLALAWHTENHTAITLRKGCFCKLRCRRFIGVGQGRGGNGSPAGCDTGIFEYQRERITSDNQRPDAKNRHGDTRHIDRCTQFHQEQILSHQIPGSMGDRYHWIRRLWRTVFLKKILDNRLSVLAVGGNYSCACPALWCGTTTSPFALGL